MDRFKKQIVESECFRRLKNKYKDEFVEFMISKVKPINGNLFNENLGLSKEDHQDLMDNCNIIINCAAKYYITIS